ncbi:DUF4870 domain-containing protein [Gillisia limnaea]|uniref:Import component protein n=1 Tax=Gillisia limnaea (strain DSM 15749 / LMG 21470 / R-8282) TaxID=865937 RepID=H2BVZ6_GILLR|nr:hypothetical protein [Gillisia limnaea]EHQ02913.1 hypothetical protein Gilli_2282 [Gillisia limnaea DSM 15749]
MENQQSQSNLIEKTGEDKTIAVIAYLTFIGLIIAFVMNNDKKYEFASFHIKQSLGLLLISAGLFIIGMIPILGWIISFLGSIFLLVLWIFGLINAINYQTKPVPVLGNYFIEWFKNI